MGLFSAVVRVGREETSPRLVEMTVVGDSNRCKYDLINRGSLDQL